MKPIKKQRTILIVFFVLPLLFISSCGNGQRKLNDPNLPAYSLLFEYPENAEERYSKLVTGTDLESVFKRDVINIFYPKNAWCGRVRDRGISYQAILAIDNSRVIYQDKKLSRHLHFSIFNPAGSKLFYLVYLEQNKKRKKLYSGHFNDLQFYNGQVELDPAFGENAQLVFETRGEGIGAWVNPRFFLGDVSPAVAAGKEEGSHGTSGIESKSECKNRKPRVTVVIVLDTLRSDHTSLYGYERETTPVMKRLAKDGLVFKNVVSSTCWTLPAHVSLFSGRNLVEHRVVSPEDSISTEYPLLAEIFQSRGYVTAAFTGGGFVNDHYGFHRGFQFYSNLPGRVFHLRSAEMVCEHFKNYIQGYQGQDMFIFLHTYQIHAPYKFPPSYVRHFNKDLNDNLKGPGNFLKDRKVEYYKALPGETRQFLIDLYDTSIFYADEALVGGVVRYLKAEGLYDEAMIVVTSDHGEEFYEHGSWEHGHSVYNEVIRVPLVIKYPGNKIKGEEQRLVSITDIAGIILRNSNLEIDEQTLQAFGKPYGDYGTNRVLPVLFPQSPIIEHVPPKISFVDSHWHFIYNMIDPQKIATFNPQPQNLEVYELYREEDHQETENVAKKHSAELKEYRRMVKKYLELLRNLRSKKSKLGLELEKELKSLGYLEGK